MSASSDPVRVERTGAVLVVTIDRPEVRNAVDARVATGVGRAVEVANEDPSVRVLVLTGAGDLSFCAGADLKALSRGESLSTPETQSWGFAGFVQHVCRVPTIAAVNGTALGGGTELALACDLVVAAPHATFGLPEVTRGLIAAAGGAFRIGAQLPAKVAMHLLLTGQPMSAADALRWGLVNEVADGPVLDAALALAEVVAANAPLSVQASKRLAALARPDEAAAWAQTLDEAMAVMTSADAMEGPTAFAEKRAPVWQGR